MNKYYELIIFIVVTKDYADLLRDAVEENKIYFRHRLYRQHTVIIGMTLSKIYLELEDLWIKSLLWIIFHKIQNAERKWN